MILRGKKVLMVGLGLQGGGVSTVRWLINKGAQVTITDLKTRNQLRQSLEKLKNYKLKLVLGKNPPALLASVDLVVQNPAVAADAPIIVKAKKLKIPIENEASIFFKLCSVPITAVTGSKGKSTTTSWLGHIFKSSGQRTVVAGNIKDRLMLAELPKIRQNHRVVLELSSAQLEGLGPFKLSPHIAVLTNILPDHLDRYKNLSNYTLAKSNIFKFQSKSDALVINYDDLICRKISSKAPGKIYWYSVRKKVPRGGYIFQRSAFFVDRNKRMKLFDVKDVNLLGEHNLSNALAAATAAAVSGLTTSMIQRGVRTFSGIHSRQESVRIFRGVLYVNDTTATMPKATQVAILAFKNNKITLIAGGHDKKLDYRELVKVIVKYVNKLVLLPGSATKKIVRTLPKNYYYQLAVDMSDAVKKAADSTPRGGTVLLSPGAASFGLFKNEWDRGAQFIKQVRLLK